MSPIFFLRFWHVFVFFFNWINRINFSKISGVFEVRCLECPFLFFSSLSGFSSILVQASGHIWFGRDVVWIFLSVSPRTTYILVEEFRSIMWISWNPTTKLTDFCFRGHSHGNHFFFLVLHPNRCELTWWHQWIRKLYSRFNMMTVNEVSLNRPKSSFISSSSFVSSDSKLFPIALILRRDSLSSRCVPVSEWVLGIRSLTLIMLLNHLPQWIRILNLFGLSGLLLHSAFWDKFLMRPALLILQHQQKSEYLPSKISPRSEHILERFLVVLSFRIDEFSLCLSLGLWEVFLQCTRWNNWSFERFTKSSFIRSFPVCQEVLDISQIAMAFRRIWPPLIIQSGLQQYSWFSLFYSSCSSFCNSVCFWAIRCRRSMIPCSFFTGFPNFMNCPYK